MKKNRREYILELTVTHLKWLNYDYGWNQMSHPELCEYVYKVYSIQLEPLRSEYRAGRLSERMHELLTEGYKYAREDYTVVDGKDGTLATISSIVGWKHPTYMCGDEIDIFADEQREDYIAIGFN